VKFYLDEHIPKGVVEGLRRRGLDVLTVQEAGRSGDSDEKQLAFAAREGRVLVTFDDDFSNRGACEFIRAVLSYRKFNLRFGNGKSE
jgi:predicted nuclease of predicted toxin-antitoxin system